jgi:hypothetical protein
MPTKCARHIRELDHYQIARPDVLDFVIGFAVKEKLAAVGSKSLVDPFEVLLNLGTESCFSDNRNRVDCQRPPLRT